MQCHFYGPFCREILSFGRFLARTWEYSPSEIIVDTAWFLLRLILPKYKEINWKRWHGKDNIEIPYDFESKCEHMLIYDVAWPSRICEMQKRNQASSKSRRPSKYRHVEVAALNRCDNFNEAVFIYYIAGSHRHGSILSQPRYRSYGRHREWYCHYVPLICYLVNI